MPINYKIKFRIVVSTFRNYSGPLRDCPISITRVNDALILIGLYCATMSHGICHRQNPHQKKYRDFCRRGYAQNQRFPQEFLLFL